MSQLQTATTAASNTLLVDQTESSQPRELSEILDRVAATIAPVWPLKDYVAVNPYQGLADREFLDARNLLQLVSECELLMPLRHYAEQYACGKFCEQDIAEAIAEAELAGRQIAATAAEIVIRLQSFNGDEPEAATATATKLRTVAQWIDQLAARKDAGTGNWLEAIQEEISKHLSAHYDEGQAVWPSPWKRLPLFQAWRSAAIHDRNVELLGLTGFRAFTAQLPVDPEASIEYSLQTIGVPRSSWEHYLLAAALSIPGWAAYASYKDRVASADNDGDAGDDQHLIGLLAIRLAYDAALVHCPTIEIAEEISERYASEAEHDCFEPNDEAVTIQAILLRASEIAYRRSLIAAIETQPAASAKRSLAQMVFCIDVRSERLRRHLEAQSPDVETIGFAGFFGMPLEHVPLGETCGDAHVPVLLQPSFRLREGLHGGDQAQTEDVIEKRRQIRTWRSLWKDFQSSAIGCFSFVETAGLLYLGSLLRRTAGRPPRLTDSRSDGVGRHQADRLAPTLRGLNHQGITTSVQADIAENMLRGMGLTENFARLVVFCGHASKTDNNPLAASLDCGACGGHSGEPNARLAAMLCNQPYIRSALAERGLVIPADTHFLAAVHNTTCDQVEFFDCSEIPASHRQDFEQLRVDVELAGRNTIAERMPTLDCQSAGDVERRASDWSEVRPEWGLVSNAAFLVAPREMTRGESLEGRAFLHNYDHRRDPDGSVLETIMTAPMVVAHWINMQYFASTVDQRHFGSGCKTIHNVVGRFGILSGHSGDLKTGMPWQSVHDGRQWRHEPLRLQSVIAAPRDSIERVIRKHKLVADLLHHGWLHLIAIEQTKCYRYAEDRSWQPLSSNQSAELPARSVSEAAHSSPR